MDGSDVTSENLSSFLFRIPSIDEEAIDSQIRRMSDRMFDNAAMPVAILASIEITGNNLALTRGCRVEYEQGSASSEWGPSDASDRDTIWMQLWSSLDRIRQTPEVKGWQEQFLLDFRMLIDLEVNP